MKQFVAIIVALSSTAAFAFECKVGPKEKVINVSESGNYVVRDGGYAYMVEYDDKDQYLVIAIEGGPLNLNVTHESYGPKNSYLSLGKKGEFSDNVISCK